jgi:hypothetical protein
VVGFDIVVDPPEAPITWELYLDDQPWPIDDVFDQRLVPHADLLPAIDPRRDLGFFLSK